MSEMITECVRDSGVMRNDIVTSIEVIKDAKEEDFRPVMASYYDRVGHFEECVEEVKNQHIHCTVLEFNNVEDVSKQVAELIQVGF